MFMMQTLTMLTTLMMMNLSPMTMIMAILMFSSVSMVMKWMETSNAWMPLIFTLAFLGGMMIIFMYVISISKVKNKKNKNKQPSGFVFVAMSLWSLKYGSSPPMTHMFISSSFMQYAFLCCLIVLILFITTKIINSPFKALKSSF